MNIVELLLCIVFISISAYLSAAELALFSLSRFQLRTLRDNFRNVHRKIKKLLADPGGLLFTLLVLNEVMSIALSSVIASSISRADHSSFWLADRFAQLPRWGYDVILDIVITAPLILLLGEVTPKVIGAKANRLISTITVGPLELIYDIFKPIRLALRLWATALGRLMNRATHAKASSEPEMLKEADFLLMVEAGHKEGAIEQSELELIQNVFEFDDTSLIEIMTPIHEVQSFPIHTTLKTAINSLRTQRHSRIPIIGNHRKQVLGVLYAKDLLRPKLNPSLLEKPVTELMRKPFFVSQTTRLNSLFRKFKQTRTHMAVVQDALGNTIGIVTMSDILDALFDDILPDTEPGPVKNRTKRL